MLRASGNLRIVAMSYLAGGCLAAVGLVAVVALTPTGEAVREVLTAPFVQLTERGRPPVRQAEVASTAVEQLALLPFERVSETGEQSVVARASSALVSQAPRVVLTTVAD